MSNRQKSLEKVRAAGEAPSFLCGQCRDQAFIAKQSGTVFRFDWEAETFVSAFDISTYEDFVLQNDFSREPRYRALNDYKVTLLKSDEELPCGDWFENDPNFGYSSQWQTFVHERAKKDNKTLPPLEESAQPLAQKSSTSSTQVPPIGSAPVTALLPPPNQALALESVLVSSSVQSAAVQAPLQPSESTRTPVLSVKMPAPTSSAPSASAVMLTPMSQ